jgi:polysaccharide pyruvyl transferase CsaB
MLQIGISGSYGGFNMGDEAILEGMLRQLRQTVEAAVTVFSADAGDTRLRHQVEHVVPVRRLSREESRCEVERLDLFVLGGGGILYDARVLAYLREVALAHELEVPVFVYAVSAGPLAEHEPRSAVRERLDRAAVLTVRDRRSKRLLEDVGVSAPIRVTADPALLIETAPPSEQLIADEGIRPGQRLIGMSVREPGAAAPNLDVGHYHQLLANAADFMIERYDATLVFVPMEPRVLDQQHSHGVISRMANARRALVLKRDYSVCELLSLIGRFEFALGMRLHFLIFAALQGVPFLALPYSSKISGFIEEFGMEMPHIGGLNAGQLLSCIDRAWDHRQELKAQIRGGLPKLQQRARETNRLLVELLTQREHGSAARS